MKNIFAILLLLVTSPVYATKYYVDCNNGSNNNSGTSHAQAWKSVSKVNSNVTVSGDDVYFLAGCTWNERLVIDWGGTSGNRAVVGSYYNNGTETIGVPNSTEKPTFMGTCVDQSNCPYNTADSIPASEWSAMVAIKGNYTTVQNLKTKNSSGSGIDVIGSTSEGQKYNNNYILNNTVDHALRNAIFLNRTSHTNIIRGNTVTRTAVIYPYGFHTNWPAAISMGLSNYNVIEDNYIYNTFGEGIGIYSKSDYNIIRNNIVIKGNKAGIYVSCSDNNIIENNKVLGDRTDDFASINNGFPSTNAFGAASESYCKADTKNNTFRNNLAANVKSCFFNSIQEGASIEGYVVTNEFYNNTCVHALQGFVNISGSGAGKSYATFKNNIVTDVTTICSRVDTNSTVDYNHWDTTPLNASCAGANDTTGDPTLNVSAGWDSVGANNIAPDNHFDVQAGSTALNAGTPLTTTVFTAADYPLFNSLDNSCGFDQTINSYDHNCNKRTNFDMGAFSNTVNVSSNTPQTPTGLSFVTRK